MNKAYCAQGAVVACTGAAATRVRTVPPLGASSAGSPLSATAAAASLAYVADRPGLRKTLRDTADYLRIRLRNIGLDPSESPAPIVTFKSGTFADMHALQRRAFERGIYLHHSTYIGAGPEGVIRCAIFRDHSRQDMDELIDALG
ncbi:MAG: aminotransferase class I/II-fold pyridoxal phosphate-dependent enzyme [Gammaproteobacteria bacterium]